MESPFASANSSVVLYLEPYLNTHYKTYQDIITLSAMPVGPLSQLVSTISSPKLSPFHDFNTLSSHNCTFALLRYPSGSNRHSQKHSDYFMGAEDIPSVFSYLQQNGYTVDTQLTKMLFKSKIHVGGNNTSMYSGNRKMICMIQHTP